MPCALIFDTDQELHNAVQILTRDQPFLVEAIYYREDEVLCRIPNKN